MLHLRSQLGIIIQLISWNAVCFAAKRGGLAHPEEPQNIRQGPEIDAAHSNWFYAGACDVATIVVILVATQPNATVAAASLLSSSKEKLSKLNQAQVT